MAAMNQKTLREGVIRGAMCSICGLVCQRLTDPAQYGVNGVRNSYGGLIAHRRIVHGIQTTSQRRGA